MSEAYYYPETACEHHATKGCGGIVNRDMKEGFTLIRTYLQDNLLFTDGAMGTYYGEITGKYNEFPELANISDPETIERIHNAYIAAGAKLIKTNTFSANSIVLDRPRTEVAKIITAGWEIANRAAGKKDVFVAASIGPIPDVTEQAELNPATILAEYKFIVDTFLAGKVKIFIFETFSELTYLQEIVPYLKEKDASVFILTQFATTPEGYTRKGISMEHIIAGVKTCGGIDAYGFNCGVGPGHLYNNLKDISFGNDIVAVAPNAGYPEIMHARTVYVQNTGYFAARMKEISALGVKILGGCCGTTPAHIEKMVNLIKPGPVITPPKRETAQKPVNLAAGRQAGDFFSKLKHNQFIVAVELDPPFNADPETVLHNARLCKQHGVDVITIADSPMGRARVDSVMLAAKVKREVGIEVIPHICCRDKNINALKSTLLAGYMENIRNVLAVTGDPIAAAERNEVKGVFNLNSLRLMELLSIMNKEVFAAEPVNIGGALNLNVPQPAEELLRLCKKKEMGAGFFLTQPIYDDGVIDFLSRIDRQAHRYILGGVMPLVSYKNAQFLNNEVAGIRIPDRIVRRFDPRMSREEAENLGVEIAVEIAGRLRNHVHGFYFITPFNRAGMIVKILQRLNLA